MSKTLVRTTSSDALFAGVCGGFARYFDIDGTLVRLVLVLFTLLGGSGVLVYLIAWGLMPSDTGERAIAPWVLLTIPFLCFLCTLCGSLFGN